jgi:hypothetical protein
VHRFESEHGEISMDGQMVIDSKQVN